MSDTGKTTNSPGIRLSMSKLHIWVGLLAGWVLYAIFITGTASFFRDEITQWMHPEISAHAQLDKNPETAGRVAAELQQIAPQSPLWFINLPHGRMDTVQASWRTPSGFVSGTFDPLRGDRLTSHATAGGDFFYRFHFNLSNNKSILGRWIAGLAALFMLVAIVSGVITHKKIFVDFFTFRWGKGQRSWLDAHNGLSVLGLPFHLMITYTGLVTLMFLYMPWSPIAAYSKPAERIALSNNLASFVPPAKPTGVPAPLASIGQMVQEAERHWNGRAGRLQINNPGDAAATVVVSRQDAERVSTSPQYLVFDGVSGQIRNSVEAAPAAIEAWGVMYGLHMGRFADITTRWLYFILSLAGTAMTGTGLVLWTVKRQQKLQGGARMPVGLWIVQRLNVAVIGGLSIAMAAYLWSNRLLPDTLAQRASCEVDVFFAAWFLAFLHALLRPARQAWIEQWWAGAMLLGLLPVLNAITTNRSLLASAVAHDWVFVGFDLTVLALAGLHAALAWGVMRHRNRTKAITPLPMQAAPATEQPR